MASKNSYYSVRYWEDRYRNGGNSGSGSYNQAATIKANYINSVIAKYKIQTINDFGHGDGNQISLLKGFSHYTGYDVSSSVRDRVTKRFREDKRYTFLDSVETMSKADLTMSLDVLYHLVEYEVWELHLKWLFTLGEYVLIYGMDREDRGDRHVVSRRFTEYIERLYDNFTLLETADGSHEKVKFYLYKKI